MGRARKYNMKYVMRLKVSASNDDKRFANMEPAKPIKDKKHRILIDMNFKQKENSTNLYDIKCRISIGGILVKPFERSFTVNYIPNKNTVPREFAEEVYKKIYWHYFNKGYFSILVEDFHVDEFRDYWSEEKEVKEDDTNTDMDSAASAS